MTTLNTPTGAIVVADSIRELSAEAHLRFNQAWLAQTGLANDQHGIQEHLKRLALFIQADDKAGLVNSFDNLIEAVNTLEAGVPLLAAVLAPCVRSIGAVAHTDLTPDGLARTALAILATGIGQAELLEAVEELKKKSSAN